MNEELNILLVEDNPGDADLIREMLPGAHRLDQAVRMSEAVILLRVNFYDIVLADLGLPDSQGLSTVERLVAEAPGVPLVVLTGLADEAVGVAAIKSGAQDYLSKGQVDGNLLSKTIDYALERKASEKRYQKMALDWQRTFDATTDLVMILDQDQRVVRANSATSRYLGMVGRELVGQRCWELFHRTTQPPEYCPIVASRISGRREETEVWIGEQGRWLWITAEPIIGAEGGVHEYIHMVRDVTQRKNSEEALRLTAKVLRELNEGAESEKVIRQILMLIQEDAGVDAIGLRISQGEDYPYYEQNGFSMEFLKKENSLCARAENGAMLRNAKGGAVLECLCGLVLRGGTDPTMPCFTKGGSFWSNRLSELRQLLPFDNPLVRLRNSCLQSGYESLALVPVRNKSEIIGLLQLNDRGAGKFSAEQIAFYEQLCSSIGVALKQRQSVEALQSSESRLKEAQKIGRIGAWSFDPATERYLFSDQMYVLFGRDPSFGPPSMSEVLSCFHPDDSQEVLANLRLALEKGRPWQHDVRVVLPEGRRAWHRCIGVPEKGPDGKILRILGTTQDISESKEADIALRESEAQYRSLYRQFQGILDSNPDIMMQLAPDLRILWANKATAAACKEIANTNDQRCYQILHDEGEACPECPSLRAIASGRVEIGEIESWAGAIREVRAIPIKDEDGKVVSVIIMERDITEHRRLGDQFRQAQKMESIGRLAGGVAHDFNNMLSVILGYAELLRERFPPADPIYEEVDEIYQAAVRSAEITRQLLAFARKQTIAPMVLDLNRTVEGLLRMLGRLIGEDIILRWLPADGLWSVKIDPAQVDQLLANLCINARDAIENTGQISIETKNVSFGASYCAEHPDFIPGDFVLLAVSDDGCGMDRATVQKIFEPFFTTKGVGQGTGLGLATVYGIVKQNGGFINVYSEPGKGSTFKVYFVRQDAEGDCLPVREQPSLPSSRGETVLIVEDDASILKYAKRMLEDSGYVVLSAARPLEALALMESQSSPIELLITDVIMPEMNGKELASKAVQLYPELLVLFMSGYTANVIAHHGVLDEGVSFLQKPFSRDQLILKVNEVLDRRGPG